MPSGLKFLSSPNTTKEIFLCELEEDVLRKQYSGQKLSTNKPISDMDHGQGNV